MDVECTLPKNCYKLSKKNNDKNIIWECEFSINTLLLFYFIHIRSDSNYDEIKMSYTLSGNP